MEPFINSTAKQLTIFRNKLYLSSGESPINPKGLKIIYHSLKGSALAGGAIMLSYRLLLDFFTHHNESQDIPDIIHHAKCWAIISAIGSAYYLGPLQWFAPMIFVTLFMFPIYWLGRERILGKFIPFNKDVYYLSSVSQAERDMYEQRDHIEALGHSMAKEWGFGRRA